jgi:hypothetical protein
MENTRVKLKKISRSINVFPMQDPPEGYELARGCELWVIGGWSGLTTKEDIEQMLADENISNYEYRDEYKVFYVKYMPPVPGNMKNVDQMMEEFESLPLNNNDDAENICNHMLKLFTADFAEIIKVSDVKSTAEVDAIAMSQSNKWNRFANKCWSTVPENKRKYLLTNVEPDMFNQYYQAVLKPQLVDQYLHRF